MLVLRVNNLPATYPNVDLDLVQRIYLCNFETNVTSKRTLII